MNKKFSIKSKKFRKWMIGLSSAILLSGVPLALASCSSDSKALTEKDLVQTGIANGNEYYAKRTSDKSNWIDIKSTFVNGLKSRSVNEQLMTDQLNEMWLHLIDNIISIDKQERYRIDKESEWKKIDTDYSDLVKNLKESNPDDWQIVLQKETLDDNGGTESSYKKIKKLAWASSYLSSSIFSNNYLKVKVGNSFKSNPTPGQIFDAVESETKSTKSFVFDSRSKDDGNALIGATGGKDGSNFSVNSFFAALQEYVFNLWMAIEQPFVVNMSLWKYGNPSEGIDSFYKIPSTVTTPDSGSTDNGNSSSSKASTASYVQTRDGDSSSDSSSDSSGDSSSSTAASYNFPYFQNGIYDGTNTTETTVTKFINFIKDGQSNGFDTVKEGTTTKSGIGLIDIPKQYTEDSSTYILAKRSSIFADLYPEFAAASMSLFDNSFPNVTKNVDTNSAPTTKDKFDFITSLFISDSTISNNFESTITPEMTANFINPDGYFKSFYNKKMYSIDSFKLTNTNLTNFVLLRDSAGVHAITIDGLKSFNTKQGLDKITAMKLPILYRAMYSKCNYSPIEQDPVFSLDIKSQIQTFFNENTALIMLMLFNDIYNGTIYGQASESLGMKVDSFNYNVLKKYILNDKQPDEVKIFGGKDSNLLKLLKTSQEVDFINNKQSISSSVQSRMISTKDCYNKAYGVNTPGNGFASKWIYEQEANGEFKLSTKYDYIIDDTVVSSKVSGLDKNGGKTPKDFKLEEYYRIVDDYVNELDTKKQFQRKGQDVSETMKYSQIIWSVNDIVNTINYNYTKNDATAFTNDVKNKLLEEQTKNYFTPSKTNELSTNKYVVQFKLGVDSNLTNSINQMATDLSEQANDILTKINTEFNTYLVDKKISESSASFVNYSQWATENKSGIAWKVPTGTSTKISLDDLNKYKWASYVENNAYMNNKDEANYLNSLYTAGATLNYVLRDNGTSFLNSIKNTLSFGQDAFIVWVEKFNSKYDTVSNTTSEETLNAANGGNRLIINTNNATGGSYVNSLGGTNENATSTNTFNDVLYDIETTSHYNIKPNKDNSKTMYGYQGIVTETSSSLDSSINTRLFNSRRQATSQDPYQGVLFKYGSQVNLEARIDAMTSWSEIKSLIEEIRNEMPVFDMDQINEASTVAELKKIFIGKPAYIDDKNKIQDGNDGILGTEIATESGVFDRFTGYLSDKPFYSTPGESTTKYAVYAEQINYEDFMYVNKNKDNPVDSLAELKNNIGDNLFYNLLVQAAFNESNQSTVTNILAANNKFEVFDINVKNAFGSKWVSNWLLESEKESKA